jgi:hypothetical protein
MTKSRRSPQNGAKKEADRPLPQSVPVTQELQSATALAVVPVKRAREKIRQLCAFANLYLTTVVSPTRNKISTQILAAESDESVTAARQKWMKGTTNVRAISHKELHVLKRHLHLGLCPQECTQKHAEALGMLWPSIKRG